MPRGEADTPTPDDEQEPEVPRRATLVALVVIVVLAVGGFFLWNQLSKMAAIQDCVWEGRTNCAPITTPSRP